MSHDPKILSDLASYIGGGTEPGTGVVKVSSANDLANVRDSITALVGTGYNGTQQDDLTRGHVKLLLTTLPEGKAQNLLTHIALYNQRPDAASKSPVQKVQSFYDIIPTNPETNSIIQQAKNFSTGVMGGINSSPEIVNQQLTAPIIAKK